MVYVHASGVLDYDALLYWEFVKESFIRYDILTAGQLDQIENELIDGSASSAMTNAPRDTVQIAIGNTLVRPRGDEQ